MFKCTISPWLNLILMGYRTRFLTALKHKELFKWDLVAELCYNWGPFEAAGGIQNGWLNPRPTKPFFVTWFTKGGVVTTPLMNLKLKCRVGSPLSIDTKIMKIGQRLTSQWRFQTWPDSESGFYMNIDQNWQKIHFFAKKVPNIGISPGFLHIKKGNGVSNMSWKF